MAMRKYCEEFYCEGLDNATLMKAYNTYHTRHNLLLPEEIKQIREQYGLSQRSFSKFENFGFSHKEKGYMGTKQGEIISYIYAKDIHL